MQICSIFFNFSVISVNIDLWGIPQDDITVSDGLKGGAAGAPPPPATKLFSISCSFFAKIK